MPHSYAQNENAPSLEAGRGASMKATRLSMMRVQVVEAMEQGFSWHEAAKSAGLQISQSPAYRLLMYHVKADGLAALITTEKSSLSLVYFLQAL